MKPIPVPDNIAPSDYVGLTLRQLALILDPRFGRLSVLAEEFGLEPATVHLWIRNGRIPRKPCRRLLKRFGKKWVDVDRLAGDEQ